MARDLQLAARSSERRNVKCYSLAHHVAAPDYMLTRSPVNERRATRCEDATCAMFQTLTTARDRTMMFAGIVMATAIFLTDLAQPLGNAVGILYILVIVVGLWTEWPPYPLVAALSATLLLLIDLAVGWTSNVPSSEFVNRPLMVLVFTY